MLRIPNVAWRATTLAFVSVIALSACSGGDPGASPSAGGKQAVDIAYSITVLDQAENVVLEAAQARIAEINNEPASKVQVNLQVYVAQNSVDKQLSDVQTALVKQPDVLILSAVDTTGSLPAAQAAKDAGVKVIDKRPSDPEPPAYDVAFFGSDETRYSAATVDWMKGYLADNPDFIFRVGLIYGSPTNTPQLVRLDAIKELAEEMPERVEIVADAYGNWVTATAQNLAADFIQANPDINLIACANDTMALGAANSIEAAGKTESVMLSGYDLTEDGVERLQAGRQAFDTGVSLPDSGEQLIDLAVKMALGEYSEKTYYVTPVYSVTPENVEEYLAGQQR